jgi:hypothetical protein
MFGRAHKITSQRLAAWAALLALVFQALYAVPVSARMALDESLGQETIICLAGGGKIMAHLPGMPGKAKMHCPICVAAALTALGAIAWLLALLGERHAAASFQIAAVLLPVRLSRAHRSRAPPCLI